MNVAMQIRQLGIARSSVSISLHEREWQLRSTAMLRASPGRLRGYNTKVRSKAGQRAQNPIRLIGAAAVAMCLTGLAGCPANQATTAARPAASMAPPLAAAPTPAATPQDEARQRRVEALIAQVNQAYQSGVQSYRANQLEAARLSFDHAVDLMLTSGIDIKSDPVLNDAFEHTVDAVNALEMDALKRGNGFTPATEAAPVESAGELTFPSDPALTASLRSTLSTAGDLPLVINDQVAGYINYFANSPSFHAHMVASLERLGKYKEMIQSVLKQEGVPQDMIYLAVAESGFQPQVIDVKSGAGGMWQFMPYGNYGLTRNGYFDERFDPEKSSRAYARYIKTLYKQFGDWYLAMAAYDWGPGNVQRAVMRTGYADYWELYRRNALPRETRNYVPQILAAVIMAKNPSKYGLDHLTPMPAVTFDTVPVDYSVDLRLVADVTGTTLANIVSLNPALLRLSTPAGISYDLHIPQGTKQEFTDRISAIPEEKRAYWRFHEVVPGETLGSIAQSFRVSESDLVAANGLDPSTSVSEGDELVIPLAPPSLAASAHPLEYRVRRGDTLVTVADRYNVTAEQLRSWNHLSSSSLRPGRMIYVAQPVRLAPSSRSRRGRAARSSRGSRSVEHVSSHGRNSRVSHGASAHKSSSRSSAHASSFGHKSRKKH